MLLIGVVGIAFAAIFVRAALPAPPVITAFYRMLFAAGLLAGWFLWTRQLPTASRRGAVFAAAAGLCFGTDMALWNTSLVHTTVATSTLLVNTTPIYVGLYVWLVLGERLRARFLAGALLALAGSAVLAGLPGGGDAPLLGALLALSAGLFYAGYLLLMKSARGGVEALPALLLMTTSAAGTTGLYALLRGDPFGGFPASSWAAMLGAAVVSQLVGVLGIIWALRFLPATLASVALLGQPVMTAILGWVLLGEAMSGPALAGGAAILAGIALASQAASA